MSNRVDITSPVGRIVMGSLYEPMKTDAEGKPLVYKTGANAGQPRVNYFFALAVPKTGEAHWGHTAWGQKIWQVGATAFPQAHQAPAFSWKIEDGDSQIPNKKGRKPCDSEGFRGNWILKFSGAYQPKIYESKNGALAQILEPNAVKPGYYVEVFFGVEGNGSQSQPGIYLNHSMVCMRGYGPEIVYGPDVNAVGFGQAALPAGAMTAPPAGMMPPAQVPGMMPPAAMMPPAQVPGMMPPAQVPPAQVPGMMPPAQVPPAQVPPAGNAPIPVAPIPGFVQMAPLAAYAQPPVNGLPPVAPPVTTAPIASPFRTMTPAATTTYEAYIASGWNDALLIQHGLMFP